jgi:hypothetical protein
MTLIFRESLLSRYPRINAYDVAVHEIGVLRCLTTNNYVVVWIEAGKASIS